MQLTGLVILTAGLVLMGYSFMLTCGKEQASTDTQTELPDCNPRSAWHVFDVGVVLVLLFLCVPSFSLVGAKPFYEQFPMFKGKLLPRGQATPQGTYDAHAASLA